MCAKSGGDTIGAPSLSIGCRQSSKWLNIVLDLNGVLCQCVERSSTSRHKRTLREDQHVYSSWIPTLVGPKGMYYHPRVSEFLRFISGFATRVVVWSSMKRSTIEPIAYFLFHDLPSPYAILGQNECTNIEIGDGQFVFSFNENKLIFLKIMPQQLFRGSATFSAFTNDNTIFIDGSLEKSVCNESGNAIFLESWSRNGPESNYLLDTLVPWLSCLNTQCMPGFLQECVDQNQVGCPPLATDDPLLLHMMWGMALSAKNVGVHYNVVGVPDFNCR